jgi:hypothetical protein
MPVLTARSHNRATPFPSHPLVLLGGSLSLLASELWLSGGGLDWALASADSRGTGNGLGAEVGSVAGLGDGGGNTLVGPIMI